MWNIKKKNTIKSFIISRPTVRVARSFFYNKIFPYLKYFFYFVVAVFLLFTIYLAVFKKSRLEEIKNHVVNYGYKVINFNNSGFSRVNIYGNERTSYEEISSLARERLVNDDNTSNQEVIEDLKTKIQALPWVDEVVISVSLHDSLNIHIKEHQPFAIWQDNNKRYIVSKEAKIIAINDAEKFDSLIILTGANAYKNVKSLFNILAIDPEISRNIYSATWVGGRRWDVRFDNGLLVKLPNNDSSGNMKDAWDSLIKMYNMPGSTIGLKTIDLRIAKKIYLEYDDKTTKELKSL
jgi:cell division septal protein FtsQ